jgi:hypothetical protein
MPEQNLTRNLGEALSIDFTERFGQRFNSFYQLLGIQRLMPMASGTVIKTYTSSVTLDGSEVAPGAVIPLSEVVLEDGPTQELTWDKKRKAVPMEDIQKFGFQRAISMTDEKLIREIQKGVRTKLFEQLATGTGEASGEGLQMAMAQNWAAVSTKFEDDDVNVISFINPFDAADYLGKANISTQTAFGMTYVENFLNNRVVFMHGEIPQGTIYSTADENLVAAYAQMGGGEIGRAFDFVTEESGLIGVTHDIDKKRLTAETVTAYGIVLFAERLDGVVVGSITSTDEV